MKARSVWARKCLASAERSISCHFCSCSCNRSIRLRPTVTAAQHLWREVCDVGARQVAYLEPQAWLRLLSALALSLLLHVQVFCLLVCSLFLCHSLEETTPRKQPRPSAFHRLSLSLACCEQTDGFFLCCGLLPVCSRLFLIITVSPYANRAFLVRTQLVLVRTWLLLMFPRPSPKNLAFPYALCSLVAPCPTIAAPPVSWNWLFLIETRRKPKGLFSSHTLSLSTAYSDQS